MLHDIGSHINGVWRLAPDDEACRPTPVAQADVHAVPGNPRLLALLSIGLAGLGFSDRARKQYRIHAKKGPPFGGLFLAPGGYFNPRLLTRGFLQRTRSRPIKRLIAVRGDHSHR